MDDVQEYLKKKLQQNDLSLYEEHLLFNDACESLFLCMFFLLQPCHINNQRTLDCESLAQRMSALEEHIEQLNDRMRELEVKLEGTHSDFPMPATLPCPQLVENCCAPSVFLYGELVYEYPHVSACPLHQDVSPHTGTVLSVEQ